MVAEDDLTQVVIWLREITAPGMDGLALARRAQAGSQLIKFDSTNNQFT